MHLIEGFSPLARPATIDERCEIAWLRLVYFSVPKVDRRRRSLQLVAASFDGIAGIINACLEGRSSNA